MQSYRSASSSPSQTYEDTALLKTKQLSLLEFCFSMFCSVFNYLQIKHDGLTETKKRKNQVYNISLHEFLAMNCNKVKTSLIYMSKFPEQSSPHR